MKTITFPVGYRPQYLTQFLACLEKQNLDGYTIFCSAEKCAACIRVLKDSKLDLNIIYKQDSCGYQDHSGAKNNMFNALNAAFEAGSTFNLHLEDDFLLSPDTVDLANWYYENFKDKPTTYISYGMFGFSPRGEDYSALEEVPFFEGLGWCTFKEGWEECYKKAWFDNTLVKKYFKAHGWDWSVQAFFKEYGYKALRPLINRTQHNGRIGGTCCTVQHHDKHYTPLKWNTTERVTEYNLTGTSKETADWIK